MGLHGVIRGSYRDNGKGDGNHYSILYRGYMGSDSGHGLQKYNQTGAARATATVQLVRW